MDDRHNWLESYRSSKVDNKNYRTNNTITISVSSGKGGVGKTSWAIKMSSMLSRLGSKVLLIDCDYNLSNTLVKLNRPLSNNLMLYINKEKSFEEAIVKLDNFHLLAGCNGNVELFERKIRFDRIVMDIISKHEFSYDYIILDSPGGLNKEILNLNAFCKDRIIVLTPDKSSLTDSYSLIKLLKIRYGVKENFVLINRYNSIIQFNRVVKTISKTVKNFLGCRIYLLGGIKEYNCKKGSFDKIFFDIGNSSLNNIFLKVIKKYHDRTCGGSCSNTAHTFKYKAPASNDDIKKRLYE